MLTSTLFNHTVNLPYSIKFYKNLGFEHIQSGDFTFIYDSKSAICLSNNVRFRKGFIHFYEMPYPLKSKSHSINEHQVLVDPTGLYHYFKKEESVPSFSTSSTSILGTYAGLSLETYHWSDTIEFYKSIGYEITSGSESQGWITMSKEESMDISIMKYGSCPHSFPNPGLTYFNGGDNLQIIQNIKEAEVPIHEEITVFNTDGIVDNIILQSPDGFGFFVFSD